MIYAAIFCVAIVGANLLIGWLGPKSSPFIAFFLIGLDLSLRDKIHESWHGKNLLPKMIALVAVAGLATYLLNRGAGMIAVGSVSAFVLAMTTDTLLYQKFFDRELMFKMNVSNIGAAAVDTVAFIWIAFGVFMWKIMLLQFLAKTLGGLFWAFVIAKFSKRSGK